MTRSGCAAICIVGALLANCSGNPSDTLKEFGSYEAVSGKWREMSDPMDGPRKMLVYTLWSERDAGPGGTLLASCREGEYNVMVSLGSSGGVSFDSEATVTTKIDDKAPSAEPFIALQGDNAIQPGDGGSNAARAFLDRLDGADKLVIRLDKMVGIPMTDPPIRFDLAGGDSVIKNLGADIDSL